MAFFITTGLFCETNFCRKVTGFGGESKISIDGYKSVKQKYFDYIIRIEKKLHDNDSAPGHGLGYHLILYYVEL